MTDSEKTGGVAAKLARPNILALQPYRCARDDYSSGVLLDANENGFGPPIEHQMTLERYPDPYQIPLKEKWAELRNKGNNAVTETATTTTNILPENIFVGVGSDEAIDLLFRIFCDPGHDQVLITPPTYGMYKVCAAVNNVDIVKVPLTPDFDLEVDKVLAAVTPQVKLIFLCSPGNPTAKSLDIECVKKIIEGAPNSIVVVDEAYVDFSSSQPSAVTLVENYSNVVVLQTLSKAFGLAAIRCGFCIGPADIIQLMNNVKAPYNVNALTSELALRALTDGSAELQSKLSQILQQRALVMKGLEALPYVTKVYPSDANFILFRLAVNENCSTTALDMYKFMANECAVVTRYRGTELHCDNCIRVTVGTPDENTQFLAALQKAAENSNIV